MQLCSYAAMQLHSLLRNGVATSSSLCVVLLSSYFFSGARVLGRSDVLKDALKVVAGSSPEALWGRADRSGYLDWSELELAMGKFGAEQVSTVRANYMDDPPT